jgi:ferrous iron transport protein B
MNSCHPSTLEAAHPLDRQRTRLIALAGQPNMGKSTLFNLLTGLNQHVGNWPGKTVERREGDFRFGDESYHLVDLPGTYSLTANSPEEEIAREYILRQQPDLVLAVVSAANLERSLYLVSELVCLPVRLVVALNMMDVAAQEGIRVEPGVLQAALGVPVIPITATRAEGVKLLLKTMEILLDQDSPQTARRPEIRADHRQALEMIQQTIQGFVPAPYPPDWAALKLLEGDAKLTELVRAALPLERLEMLDATLKAHDDALWAVASGRYDWIGRMIRAAVAQPRVGQIGLTERLDRWAAHPVWGLFILAGILGGVFWLTFTLGAPLQAWLDTNLVARLAAAAAGALAQAPGWAASLIVDGLIGGVGSVLTFLPILVIFFGAFGLLEDVGYMARAAYVMDNFMHLMGLHGKSFLPLFVGFGCNVPAVIGTRVIDSWPARLLTILVAPLVPCTARMAVVAFLAPAFFGAHALWITWGLVIGSLALLVGLGALLNLLIFRGQRAAFIMEMPLYHLPNPRTIGLLIWQRTLSFLQKAGTTILGLSLGVWVLATLPNGDIQTSFLAQAGKALEPLGRLAGLDWRLSVALLASFPAKENSVATLAILFGGSGEAGLPALLGGAYPVASGLSFLTISILFIPCVATVAAIRQETGSWRWTLLNLALLFVLSFGMGGLVYWSARWFGL